MPVISPLMLLSSSPHRSQIPNMPNQNSPHIILIPLMAQGHMIPMVDMARLLATAGATITFITTVVNAARIRPIIDRIATSHLPIRFVQLPFPSADAGLPPGCENIDLIASPDILKLFMESLPLFGEQVKLFLTSNMMLATADCIVFDSMNSWAATVAKGLGIPHVAFHGMSCFFILCSHLVKKHQVLKNIDDDDVKMFKVPELPEPVEVTKAQVTRWIDVPGWERIAERYYDGERSASGVVMNTFEELEMSGLDKYRKELGKKVWPIGPLSLSDKDEDSKAMRGKASSVDTGLILSWLDSKAPNSVMFVSFGSLAQNPFLQLVQIGHGLELASSSSSLPFIWVVKEADKSVEVENWLSEFEERTRGRGMVIRGWAPQVVILSHGAVGGFMTHCGWNSILEAVAAGVVMATWPRFGDQFVNERLVVDVLRIGVPVGAKVPTMFVDEMREEEYVMGEAVREVVEKVMGGGEEGEERRKRVRELGEKARKAMEEGGSSYENLNRIIQFAKGNL